jgi:hypothetical protein
MWEAIPGSNLSSHRLKVPGGWLVRSYKETSYSSGAGHHSVMNTTFVEDAEHNWVLEKVQQ